MSTATTTAENGLPSEESTESRFTLTRKVFEPVETHFTPGERSMVAWISTDCVDHERDVVVSSGVDYKSFFLGKTPEAGNPCVLAFHDFGRWPLGRCEWVKIKQSREFNGLFAKTIFDDDPETEAVWRKIKSRSLRGISIGFRPPDDLKSGEWGPPTREELLRRPDWSGAERVIRRCVLLEYSVCSLPMNPQALVAAVNKGVHRPVFSVPSQALAQIEAGHPEIAPETEPETGAPNIRMDHDAEAKSVESEHETVGPAPSPPTPSPDRGAARESIPVPIDSATDNALEPNKEQDKDDARDEEEIGIYRRFDHVQVRTPSYNGVGRIESLHTRGHVPHVAEDMIGTTANPAARVRCYKPMGDGHIPTHDFIAVRVTSLEKRTEPLRAPSTKRSNTISPELAEVSSLSKTRGLGPLLPPIVVKSDQEVRTELIAQLNEMLSPEGFRRIAREEAERAAGFV